MAEVSAAAGLRAWAKGIYPTEAAAELLIRGFGGAFSKPGCPWIKETGLAGRHYVDGAVLAEHLGVLSGGERRYLHVVLSLLDDGAPVMLADTLPGLDRENVALVLAAVAHAAGSHEHSGISVDPASGVPTRGPAPGSLYPWPEGDA